MAFKPERVKPAYDRKVCSMRLLNKTDRDIKELASVYSSTPSKIVDALVRTYGPALKRDAK